MESNPDQAFQSYWKTASNSFLSDLVSSQQLSEVFKTKLLLVLEKNEVELTDRLVT